jgi:hypothetical protein
VNLFNTPNPEKEEFARVIPWHPQWSGGAPMPHVFANGHKTILIYLTNTKEPGWDGSYTNVVDSAGDNVYPLALVEFSGHTHRFGIANDEVFHGLPLWKKGLVGYNAHIVENSSWIEELKNINRVHAYYKESTWQNKQHFLLLFHDEIFEVIATGYKIETFNTSFTKLIAEAARRLNA